MDNRRTFLKKGSLALLALSTSTSLFPVSLRAGTKMTVKEPKTAAVIWYSQTGNSERTGRLIAETFNKKGLKVTASDYRNFDPEAIGAYDLIVAGSPVYYYDVPENFRLWLKSMPAITGKPFASYVTFGGPGGNQHNTVCTLADLLAEKGGVPVGMETFGNMSTFAITWSYGNEERVLEYKHLPDEIAYDRMRTYAGLILDRVHHGQCLEIDKDCDFRELIKILLQYGRPSFSYPIIPSTNQNASGAAHVLKNARLTQSILKIIAWTRMRASPAWDASTTARPAPFTWNSWARKYTGITIFWKGTNFRYLFRRS